jgi:hypothetical protein
MKYCLKYTNVCRHLKDADEISIKYIEDRGLVDFMEKYADKRIILRIVAKDFSDTELMKLVAIKKQFPQYQFTVALDEYHTGLIKKLREKELPFYLLKPIQNWENFHYLVNILKVSDIDLSGALAFELPKVKRYLEKVKVNTIIRITPNIIHSQTDNCPPLQHFFVRPDDIDQYEPYVDVLEFEGIEHQDTFYNIYAKEKMFIGKLNQVIYNFPLAIDNMGLIPQFGERRISCGRECLSGGRCKRCDTLAHISEVMGPQIREKIKENLQKQIEENNNATN